MLCCLLLFVHTQNVVDGWDRLYPFTQFYPFSVEDDLNSVAITVYNRSVFLVHCIG